MKVYSLDPLTKLWLIFDWKETKKKNWRRRRRKSRKRRSSRGRRKRRRKGRKKKEGRRKKRKKRTKGEQNTTNSLLSVWFVCVAVSIKYRNWYGLIFSFGTTTRITWCVKPCGRCAIKRVVLLEQTKSADIHDCFIIIAINIGGYCRFGDLDNTDWIFIYESEEI